MGPGFFFPTKWGETSQLPTKILGHFFVDDFPTPFLSRIAWNLGFGDSPLRVKSWVKMYGHLPKNWRSLDTRDPETNSIFAPENGGPLEIRKFRIWKPPFLGAIC